MIRRKNKNSEINIVISRKHWNILSIDGIQEPKSRKSKKAEKTENLLNKKTSHKDDSMFLVRDICEEIGVDVGKFIKIDEGELLRRHKEVRLY